MPVVTAFPVRSEAEQAGLLELGLTDDELVACAGVLALALDLVDRDADDDRARQELVVAADGGRNILLGASLLASGLEKLLPDDDHAERVSAYLTAALCEDCA